MKTRKVRIGRAAAALFAAAVVVMSGALPASAGVNASSVKVTNPSQSEVLSGSYPTDGSPSGFKITITGQATTSCQSGWQSIKFTVSGPSGSQVFNVNTLNDPTWSGGVGPWDTEPLKNGIYTVRLDVTEKSTSNLLDDCPNQGQSGSHYVTAKVANPARAPEWSSSPSAASDGSASVTLRWKKNGEDDVREYHIVRSGPDGTNVAPVNASSPGGQGCSLSSNVYTCVDQDFPNAYTGTYTYGIVALRERPAYNSSEDDKIECSTVSKPCVASRSSELRSASLAAPTPSPTPTDQPSTPPPSTGGGGGPSTPSSPSSSSGGSSSRGGSRVLSFGSSNEFYSGTYSENLPYQPRSMILGGGQVTRSPQAQGYGGEVISETAPDYRTVMLPVAGGLLAFLSAAHVRRLLIHL